MHIRLKRFSAPGRWRCSRGYGVHSPFAFSFITDTLRQRGYAYYAYESLTDSTEIRTWFRIVCRLQPRSIAVRGVADKQLYTDIITAARLAAPTCQITDNDAELTWWGPASKGTVSVSSGESAVLAGLPADEIGRVFGEIDHGMCFTNARGTAVIVTREDLPHQQFDLYF